MELTKGRSDTSGHGVVVDLRQAVLVEHTIDQ